MIRAKKSLGQNFLKSETALRKIIEAGEIKKDDLILEIGPGKGALTKKLLERSNSVIAIEKDRELFDFLKEKFSEQIKLGSLALIQGDVLQLDIFDAVSNFFSGPWKKSPDHSKKLKLYQKLSYKIIANIPYNITGAILKKFLTEKHQPELMVLMVQHEVAQRIVAKDKKESILSISVKAYGTPKLIEKVSKRYFSPSPKVDSAIIKISNINRENFINNKILEDKFWEIVKAGFAHKRKKLSSNLKNLLKSGHITSMRSLGDKRAEDLTLSDWIALVKQ